MSRATLGAQPEKITRRMACFLGQGVGAVTLRLLSLRRDGILGHISVSRDECRIYFTRVAEDGGVWLAELDDIERVVAAGSLLLRNALTSGQLDETFEQTLYRPLSETERSRLEKLLRELWEKGL